jgi:hypothetical protein
VVPGPGQRKAPGRSRYVRQVSGPRPPTSRSGPAQIVYALAAVVLTAQLRRFAGG